MTRDDLLHACARLGIKLAVEAGALRVRAPAGVVTPELRTALAEHKPALLEYLAAPHDELAPLSPAQRSLWLLHQGEPASLPAYNIRAARRFRGPLDDARLERALAAVVARHEPLRTSFHDRDGEPWQRIAPTVPVRITRTDVSHLPAAERETAWQTKLEAEGHRAFDLRTAPLFAVELVRLAADDHVLLLNAHHLIADAWSAGLLLRELATGYAAAGELPPPAAFRFSDHVLGLQRESGTATAQASLDYWRQQLAGLPTLALPTDDSASNTSAAYAGTSVDFTLDPAVARDLRALARGENVTLFHALVSSFAVLLQQLSGQDDFGIGTTLAGRDTREAESLVGYFVNLVVLRLRPGAANSFRALIQRARTEALAAFQHQNTPFDEIVHTLRLPRDRGTTPLFRALFLYLQTARDTASFAGLEAEAVPIPSVTAKYDLSLHVEDHGDRLGGLIEFNSARFTPATIRRFIAIWQHLLRGLVAAPDAPLGSIPALPEDETRRLLHDFNATAAPADFGGGIAAAFRIQVSRTPDAVALIHEDRALTYAQLDAASDRFAARLRASGVGPEKLVGVCVERSAEMVVALLAILKAGGAYLPLDPTYPADRVAFMLADARPLLLLTQKRLVATLPAAAVTRLLVDGIANASDGAASFDPVTIEPAQTAYVIYTSGSTGRPKGVMVTQGNVMNFFAGMDAQLGRAPGVWLALTSISFDISVLELFWTLARGFKVIVQSDEPKTAAPRAVTSTSSTRPLDFSLFYFSGEATRPGPGKYRLLLEGAKFADANGFAAVWTPERHFHAFGGLFPNPSVLGGALAIATQRVAIRAGSVVLPLHDPVRVAEEWAAVDNLSNGRVGVSFAAGWHPHDFTLAPQNFAERRRVMFEQLAQVRALWRGEAISRRDGRGQSADVRTLPRPLQPELPVWITAGGDPETFRLAGEAGTGLLTHLLGQSPDELGEKIAHYRAAWRTAGHPGEGHVTVMLHTFIGDDLAAVRERVRKPFREYLRTSVDLIAGVAKTMGLDLRAPGFTDDDFEAVLDHAFERYFETSALMGTPASCRPLVERLRAMTVDEIACLIDFGVEEDAALAGLERLAALRDSVTAAPAPGRSIAEQFALHRPTHLQATPSRVKMLLLDPPVAEALGGLTRLIVGGEALPPALAADLATRVRGETHNLYGPTETTVWSTGHRLQRNEKSVRIGQPLTNQQVYVLDRELQPVPLGVAGELYIGGMGVTRGYLGRPEITAERFLPDPFGVAPGGRIYRTGDLARWREDGTLECLGRADDQVKILGHRIEPGEIEAVLAKHPAVQAGAVTAPLGADGERRLAAYTVVKPGATLKASALRAWLHERLPEHMVPAAIVFLPTLPLTPNGKTDRRALPAPEAAASEPARDFVAPRNAAERLVAGIWAKLLSRPQVAAHDNFFEIGGHSLLAMQMIARVRQETGAELPLRSLFEAPTVAGVAARIGGSMPADGIAPADTLVPVPRDGRPLPLSFGQRRLWFIEQLEPGRSTHHVPAAIRLRGRCDVDALAASFTDLVRRHEALRTHFPIREGEPHQEIAAADACAFTLATEDLREFPAAEREARARVRAVEEVAIPFDLKNGPLLRARLLRLADDDHLLVFVIHHIVSDGWTMGLITRELTALYAARCAGRDAALPALAVHYADFAAWQRANLTEEALRPALAFWKDYLAGGVAAEIPGDRPRPRMLDGHGREFRFAWPAELTGALQQLGQREGATLFMTLLAGYTALLARTTRQDDLVVGTSVANRPRPEFEAMAGFFVNLLPVRVDTSGNPTFTELLARVKQACLAGYAHQDTPFESLIDAVAPGRDLSRTPIFQTMLVLLNAPAATARLGDLEIAPVPLENRSAKFDLTLLGEETAGELRWVAEYRTEIYDEATIARLVDHLRLLLAAATRAPETRLFALPLLTSTEVEAQRAWNRTSRQFPADRWIHEFPRQFPDGQSALGFAGETLGYGEFNGRADALAALLVERGAGPESLVAVFLERSFELVLSLHAILRAGAAYVPIDPDYPAERVAYMLADAQPKFVLTVSELASQLPLTTAAVLHLDALPAANRALVAPALHGESAAYMIYTSGSTGRPKGAVNTHAGILNRLQWMQAALPLNADDRVLQKTPYSFDVSVWEFFWPLMTGATLVVAEPGVHKDPAQLIALIVAQRITTLHFVPSMLRAFLAAPGVERCVSLRQVICSGEELPRDLVRLCQQKLPGAAVHNLYGPTEAAVDVTWHACTRDADGPVPIGAPIANLEIHVLDPELQPVPVGMPGEVYLGGIGLGRGYHRQPALTAERWVPHPAGEPGARLYHTGDLGRRLPNGEVEYLGRVDFQVKLRGLRIELGEIDAALRAHPQVADAVCVLRNEAPAGARLVGYVVPRDASLNTAELRSWLGTRLPDYMVPTAWVRLEKLPLSPAGKIDRRALPAPSAERAAVHVAPRDADEIAVAAIWSEVLARPNVGATDDFFELGGHSLIATQVMTRLHERVGVTLPLRVLFEQTTVEAFAAAVRAARASQSTTVASVLKRTARERRKVVVQADGEIGAVETAGRN
jgi:natural product biosynthesis luciferase-like monooxygenase protein/amino acid adenylation domain-containing protein